MFAWERKITFHCILEERQKDSCLLYTQSLQLIKLTPKLLLYSSGSQKAANQINTSSYSFVRSKRCLQLESEFTIKDDSSVSYTVSSGIQAQALSDEDFKWDTAEKDQQSNRHFSKWKCRSQCSLYNSGPALEVRLPGAQTCGNTLLLQIL